MDEGEPSRATVASFEDLRTRPARASTKVAAAAFAILVCYALFNQPTEQDQIEPAAVASPRTPWSSRSANQSRKWTAYQASLVRDASAYQSGKSSRLVLMGDSITEAWVGTGYGSPTRVQRACRPCSTRRSRATGRPRRSCSPSPVTGP